ncbi:MAG: hypothetical protein J5608_00905 [Alphaproteobacteria bacterium]|nr:hypothetical protein [Alphaproteobacteria bacterium]
MKNQNVTNACKNAIGTMFLLAGAFFICSTLLSMRTVLADPIAPANATQSRLAPARVAPGRTRANTRTTASRGTAARSTVARTTNASSSTSASRSTAATATNTQAAPRSNVKTRSVSVRGTNGNVRTVSGTKNVQNAATRSIVARGNANNNVTMRGMAARNGNRVVARSAGTAGRVGVIGSGMRATFGTTKGINVSYLTNKLYTGNYSNIIDSTTGMISADAYSTCLESYYTCMDEICTARSDTKGRCSCAGRATNFLDAEAALEKANEELINLSGQLALLVATKGKDVSEAFKLTDAEKVMNCVSYQDMINEYGSGSNTADSTKVKEWCYAHGFYTENCGMPSYCKESGNNFGFDISEINGSSSDILASLQAWADAKDLAKQYTIDDSNNLVTSIVGVSGVVNGLAGITTSTTNQTDLDNLADTWGYKLFRYAHNNVCGRVLDSCFNGIYEACGTPPSVEVEDNKTTKLCANNAIGNCPFNYNSKIAINKNTGDVELQERHHTDSTTTTTSATCFGYTSASGDPYSSVRGPVADARRSIMQKYLLDANAACDAYGTSLKNTAQNINYQKIAAEQALRQKRMEFYNEEQTTTLNDAITAASNFDECISEILDCYETNADNTTSGGAKWTDARIKTYCAQVANVPHCYEDMICNPSTAQFKAIIDTQDSTSCSNSQEYKDNTCRNIVTLNEILKGTGASPVLIAAGGTGNSAGFRERCLLDAGIGDIRDWSMDSWSTTNIRCTLTELRAKDPNASAGYKTSASETECTHITACNVGYIYDGDQEKCDKASVDCTESITGAASAERIWSNGALGTCTLYACKEHYNKVNNTCVLETISCTETALAGRHAIAGSKTWNPASQNFDECEIELCESNYHKVNNDCVSNTRDCDPMPEHATAGTQTWTNNAWGDCAISECATGYDLTDDACVAHTGD